jgi:hypothetical protein
VSSMFDRLILFDNLLTVTITMAQLSGLSPLFSHSSAILSQVSLVP